MQLNPAALRSQQYILLDKLSHQDLVPFIQTYLKKRTGFSRFYWFINILFIAATLTQLGWGIHTGIYSVKTAISGVSNGILLAFTLIPLHELIHVLAYRSQGAKHTSFDANFRKLIFLAVADQFVANKKEFQVIALAPFVLISLLLIMALFWTNPIGDLTICWMLVVHTACCSGDFGLLSYFEFHLDKEVVTYDDRADKTSYFYAKPQSD